MSDVLEELTGQSDVGFIARILDLFDGKIEVKGDGDFERVIRRVFAPILLSPTDLTIGWVRRVVMDRRGSIKNLNDDTRTEFASRISVALENPDIGPLADLLNETATCLATEAASDGKDRPA